MATMTEKTSYASGDLKLEIIWGYTPRTGWDKSVERLAGDKSKSENDLKLTLELSYDKHEYTATEAVKLELERGAGTVVHSPKNSSSLEYASERIAYNFARHLLRKNRKALRDDIRKFVKEALETETNIPVQQHAHF